MIDKLTKCKFYRFNTFSVIPDEYFAGNLEKIMNNTLRPIRHTWRGRYFVNPIHISLDGQYGSPGYSAELCCVPAIDNESKQVMRFEAVQKNEKTMPQQ
uniref:Uncharacterized protein n=1 Tax=Ditylenchus dipsaci TaxID=166011 RepID=A0A915EI44_9BILA